ncbi:MAG: CAP domain-containing protein [Angelakisella sp.]
MKKLKIMILATAVVCTMTTRAFAESYPTSTCTPSDTTTRQLQSGNFSDYIGYLNCNDLNLDVIRDDLYDSVNGNESLSEIVKIISDNICNQEIPDSDCDSEKPETPDEDAPVVDKPVVDKPVVDKPVVDKPVVDKPTTDLSDAQLAEEVVRLVNAERAKAGLNPLVADSNIAAAAYVRSTEQPQNFSHTRPNGTSCFTALTEQGVSYRGAGENIAFGQKTPADVMNSWMNSPGHKANILNPNFTKIGVGSYKVNGTIYWTQLFTY